MSDKYRVLIIDDEPDIRSILQICLQGEFEVVSAVNGFDALEKLERCQPDVICSDISMPVMDGLTATKLIRRNADYAKTPICIISANTTADFMKEAYASGANFFISKPFEPQRVTSTVKAQIEKHKVVPRKKFYSLMRLAELEAEQARQAKASAPAPAPASSRSAPAPAKPAAPPQSRASVPAPAKVPAKPAGAPVEVPSGLQPRILIVDDEEHVVLNLCNVLSAKYEIVPIVDPLEAMEKLVKWEPDVLVMAMDMPKLNGLHLARMLQPNPALAGIEIVFTHDKVTSGIQRSAERYTRNPVLSKTDVFKDIEGVLSNIMARPGFRVRPKKATYTNVAEAFIRELEESKKEKQRELQKMYSDQRYNELRSFIGNHFDKK